MNQSKKQKLEKQAVNYIKQHDNTYRYLKEIWLDLYSRYENKPREGSITEDTETKTKLGQAFSLVENFSTRVISQVPRFNYLAREKGDTKNAELYNEFNQYQHEQADSQKQYEQVAKWGAICGMAGWKMGWEQKKTIERKKGKEIIGYKITDPTAMAVLDTMKIGKEYKENEEVEVSNWTITAIKPFDLVWDIEATEVEKANAIGHRVRKTIGQLKAEKYNTQRLINTLQSDEDYWTQRMADQHVDKSVNVDPDLITVEVVELYMKHQNNGITENYVITIASSSGACTDGVAIKITENPFDKQFVPMGFFRPISRPGKMYGFGIIEMIKSVLDTEEDMLNMYTESAYTNIARPMEYDPANALDSEAIKYRPRTLIPVRELGKTVAPLPSTPINLGEVSYLMGYTERTKQNVTAITDYQTGANQVQKSQTATEVQTKTAMAEQRSNKILQVFEQEVLIPSGRISLKLNQQYLANDKVVFRILGKKGTILEKGIKRKDVEAIKDISVVGGSSAAVTQTLERQKWAELLTMASNELSLPPEQAIKVNREEIWRNYLELGFMIKDSDTYIPSIQEQEEAEVSNKMEDLNKAKKESLDSINARVLPTDDHQVHVEIHQAILQNGEAEGQPLTPEQMEALSKHIDDHTAMMGGVPNQETGNVKPIEQLQ